VFKNDVVMLEAARRKMKEDFRQNKTENNPDKIEELLKTAVESEEVLRRLIVQGVRKSDGTYKLNFRDDTVLEDNAPLPKR
jgi:FixJ family two-component response regulator